MLSECPLINKSSATIFTAKAWLHRRLQKIGSMGFLATNLAIFFAWSFRYFEHNAFMISWNRGDATICMFGFPVLFQVLLTIERPVTDLTDILSSFTSYCLYFVAFEMIFKRSFTAKSLWALTACKQFSHLFRFFVYNLLVDLSDIFQNCGTLKSHLLFTFILKLFL